ncbi:16S rRNA (cytosine(1402)-N(4))-methyltransferase RsmH [candidate division KSB1 bacterium]|nr:16S rRNA (cytosine(1402)-N(4))-methyltransferase RsmH [candidate division KSB1 bacterium]
MNEQYHIPVLLDQVVASVQPETAEVILDLCLGDGGYSLELLKKMPATSLVVGVDRDAEAINRAGKRLMSYGHRFRTLKGNFRDVGKLLAGINIFKVDGIIVDLGISLLQIRDAAKGFSYARSGPLSMQMGDDSAINAEVVVNEFSEEKLANIFWEFGEERASRRLARAIVSRRREKRFETTGDLASVVYDMKLRYPVKTLARLFQSIRIFVNDELESLKLVLPQAVELLKKSRRLAVLSYHSGEDKITKQFMNEMAKFCICPPDFPVCRCNKKASLKIVHRLIVPSAEEIEKNPNSRSAKLRVAEKI